MIKKSIFKTSIYLFLSLSLFVSNSQNIESFDKWVFGEGETRFVLFNTESKIIENTKKNPSLVIDVFKDNEGTLGVRLSGEDIYSYSEDANFIELDFIVDDSEIFGYSSRVMESAADDWDTEIKLTRMEDEPSLFDLFDLMKKGDYIYVQTTGAGDPKVWSFKLDGFRRGYDFISKKWSEWNDTNKTNNPFKKQDGNPFKR